MVDSIEPTFGAAPTRNTPYRNEQPTQGVESHADEKTPTGPNWQRVERRKGHDRRNKQASKHPKFEMRNSRGRRKSDNAYSGIYTKA